MFGYVGFYAVENIVFIFASTFPSDVCVMKKYLFIASAKVQIFIQLNKHFWDFFSEKCHEIRDLEGTFRQC